MTSQSTRLGLGVGITNPRLTTAKRGIAVEIAARLAVGPTAATAVGKRLLQTARDHGVAAADAITPRETGQIFATHDLPAGITSLLTQGPGKATFQGR